MAVSAPGSGVLARMRRLRLLLAGSAVLLVLVVFGFLAVAHYRTRNYLTGLPKRLGVDIQQQSNSFTYSQSSKGKTLFTVHASKEVQRRDGRIALHDVGITLYGPSGQATDRIHGADFEYDQKLQKMNATGEVYIDLLPPASQRPGSESQDAESRMVHVKTIGLDFDQRAQSASTKGAVQFRTNGYAGSAVGASYDAKSGVVVLQSTVQMSGLRQGQPVLLTAARAELDRNVNSIDLISAHYVSPSDKETRSAEAQHAIVHIQPDGTPERVDADGGVRLSGGLQGEIVSKRLILVLGPAGQAKDALFTGNVRYANDEGLKHSKGHGAEMRVAFDDAGRAQHTLLSGGAAFGEQSPGSERDIDAATIEIALGGGGSQSLVVRGAQAFGPDGAHLRLVDVDSKGRSSTEVRADRLFGRFAPAGSKTIPAGLDGMGHSQVEREQLDANGVLQSRDHSVGDSLRVDFKPDADGHLQLMRAEQHGNVRTILEAQAKDGRRQVEHGQSDGVIFDAQTNLLHMMGAVQVQDASSVIFADRLDVNRRTGDATATGAVRATYLQQPAAETPAKAEQQPVHVLAARAVAHKGSGLTEFFAEPNGRARLWQGGSQVEAPLLDFYQKEKRVVALGAPGSNDSAAVRALLIASASRGGMDQAGGPMLVTSRQMSYNDNTRTAEFTGGMRVVDHGGTLTAQQATVWLASAGDASQTSKEPPGLMGGKVDRLVATGSVVLEQPGCKGTGEKLVYTAADSTYVLTGTRTSPPRMEDAAAGSTTGAALRFQSGDDSVQVLGGENGKAAGRVRSETRVKQE